MDSRDAKANALLAVERRRAADAAAALVHSSASSSHSNEIFDPTASEKLKYHRLVDTEIYPKTSTSQRLSTISILDSILSNILTPPIPENSLKYKRLRMGNANIKRNIMDVAGAYQYLIECGFRSTKEDFEHFLIFPPSPSPKTLYSLKLGALVIKITLAKVEADSERENRYKVSAKDVEAERTRKAMLLFEEDRRLKREKDARDKIVRDARAAAAAELAANPPVPADDEEAPYQPLFNARSDSRSMNLEEEEMSDDEVMDAPPSYGTLGALTGRVLGTGEEVRDSRVDTRGVNFENLQDRVDLSG